jgi:hypothetical protein
MSALVNAAWIGARFAVILIGASDWQTVIVCRG